MRRLKPLQTLISCLRSATSSLGKPGTASCPRVRGCFTAQDGMLSETTKLSSSMLMVRVRIHPASLQSARWLAEETDIAGFGVETVGIDAGAGFSLEPPFPMHHFLLGNDKYGVTSLKNLHQLPAAGAFIVVTPLPIVGGTASPARVLAFVEESGSGSTATDSPIEG